MSLLLEQFESLLTTHEAVEMLEARILAWAVQGKLLPQNSQDEPANVLLKKIKQEKKRLIEEFRKGIFVFCSLKAIVIK